MAQADLLPHQLFNPMTARGEDRLQRSDVEDLVLSLKELTSPADIWRMPSNEHQMLKGQPETIDCELRKGLSLRMRLRILPTAEDGGSGPELGGSLVEFALVLPVLMLIITGLFSISIALNSYSLLTNDVNAGARTLALSRGQTSPALAASDPCAYAIQSANNAAPLLSKSAISYSIIWAPQAGSGGSYTTSCPGLAMSAGDTIQIRAVYPAPLAIYGWRPVTVNLTAQTSELVQ